MKNEKNVYGRDGFAIAWADGHVKGMKVRGGYEVDMEWKDGKLMRVEIRNLTSEDGPCALRYGARTRTIVVKSNKATVLTEL